MLSMAACFPVYGCDAVRERATELWEGIKTEVCYSCLQSLSAHCLAGSLFLRHDNRGIGTICARISGRYTVSDRSRHPSGTRTGYCKAVFGYSARAREKPRHRCNKSSSSACPRFSSVVWDLALQLSRFLASAGKYAFSQSLPQLFRQFNHPALPSHRPPILATISSLLLGARSVYATPETKRHQYDEESLEPFREELLDVLREGLRTDGLQVSAVKGCVALIEVPGFWAKGEVEEVIRGMNTLLTGDENLETK